MRIFFSAGEASGDAYGAALLYTIQSMLGGRASAQALGGARLAEAGAQVVADSSNWGAIGIAESLKVYPKARVGLARVKRALAQGKSGVFVPIDYGYLNIGLASFAKQRGWKVIYFSPPGAWRKDRQGADLPKVTDAIITPFSWSAEILNRMGANAHWFGHPIKQMIRDAPSPLPRIERGEKAIAVLPGSRRSEIDHLLPVLAQALQGFEAVAEVAIASSLDLDEVKSKWRRFAPDRKDVFTQNDTYGVLNRARAAIVCSGTATLEAALCGCPHVVVYKVGKAVELQARLIRFKVPHIAQPNILLDRPVVPELIQHAATPEAIASELRLLLEDDEVRERQIEAFKELNSILGPSDAIEQSAKLIVEYLHGVASEHPIMS